MTYYINEECILFLHVDKISSVRTASQVRMSKNKAFAIFWKWFSFLLQSSVLNNEIYYFFFFFKVEERVSVHQFWSTFQLGWDQCTVSAGNAGPFQGEACPQAHVSPPALSLTANSDLGDHRFLMVILKWRLPFYPRLTMTFDKRWIFSQIFI